MFQITKIYDLKYNTGYLIPLNNLTFFNRDRFIPPIYNFKQCILKITKLL